MISLKNQDGGAVVLVSNSDCGMDEATQIACGRGGISVKQGMIDRIKKPDKI